MAIGAALFFVISCLVLIAYSDHNQKKHSIKNKA